MKTETRSMTKRLSRARAFASVTFAMTLALVLLAHATARNAFAQSTQTPAQSQSPAQTQSASGPGGGGGGGRTVEVRERGSGLIHGRITGEAGEPLAGVMVYVSQRGINQGFFRPQRVATDDEGNFTITGLDPGLYNINASMPGFVTDTDPATNRPAAYRPGDTASVRLVKGGVITGTVTDPQGEPVVGIAVHAYRVRDAEGRPVFLFGSNFGTEDSTDDRGVYRIYGIPPGVYVVAAGSSNFAFIGPASAYAGNVSTFYPSATRDTASEITVRAGQENAGVDIRYRDEAGRNLSGRIELAAGAQVDQNGGFGVTLNYASSGIQAANTFVQPTAGTPSFAFEGVADGDYDMEAWGGRREGRTASSPVQRVSVRGADVTGLTLKLTPLSSVSGTLVIEPQSDANRALEACKQQHSSTLPQETLVTLAADRNASAKGQTASRLSLGREATPDSSGAFKLPSLEAGRYRLYARPFDDTLYTRSIKLPATTAPATVTANPASKSAVGLGANARASNAAPSALDLRTGQQLNGVEIRLAQGAALLSGRVVVADGATTPPFSQMRVHLVPAERESVDDLLRYFDVTPDGSGAFTFKSIPPGRYLVVTRPAPEPTPDAPARPAQWDADSRARLRREAEAANASVELQPCQRTTDFTLRLK